MKKAAVVASDPVAMFHGTLGIIFPYLMRLASGANYALAGPSPTTDTLSVCKKWKELTEKSTMPLLVYRGDFRSDTDRLVPRLETMVTQGYKPSYVHWMVYGIHPHRVLMAMPRSVVTLHVSSNQPMGSWNVDAFLAAFPLLATLSGTRDIVEFNCTGMAYIDRVVRLNGSLLVDCKACGDVDVCSRCDSKTCTIEADKVCDECSGFFIDSDSSGTVQRHHPHRRHVIPPGFLQCGTMDRCAPCAEYLREDEDEGGDEEEDEGGEDTCAECGTEEATHECGACLVFLCLDCAHVGVDDDRVLCDACTEAEKRVV
jgi:hypothetical protein